MKGSRRQAAVALALFAVTAAVFWPACKGEFLLYDDQQYVYENQQVRSGLSWRNAWWALTTSHAANWHPLTWLSLQLDASLFGPGPFGFHLTNVLLHAANAALLFCALRLLAGALWRSATVAGLFALHPLHVESVAWVAERKDVLCGLFFMLTLLAYGWYARGPGWRRYLPVALCFALGLLAKPMLVTLPCLLLLLDYWPLRRLDAGWRPLVLEKLPLFALTALSCLLTWQAQQRAGAVESLEFYPLALRLRDAILAYTAYLREAFWPAGLAAYYPRPVSSLPLWQPAAAAVLLAGVTVLAVLLRRQASYVLVGWLWYLGMLVPVIGLVQVGAQARADRYTYLPLVGIFLLVTWGAAELAGRLRLPWPVPGVAAAAVLAACAACTRAQVGYWHDDAALWRHTLEVAPPSSFAHYGLAVALEKQDRRDEAIRQFQEAVRCDPDHVHAHHLLAKALTRRGRLDEAIPHLRECLRLAPGSAMAHVGLAAVLEARGDLAGAARHYGEALRLNPDLAAARYGQGVTLSKQGKWDEAAAALARAVQLQPGEARFRLQLAFALHNAGRPQLAQAQYDEATRLDPGWPAAANQTAWALAAHPDAAARNGPAALEWAQKLRQATGGKEAAYLDTLAAAYAETGRYAEAEAAAREALALHPPAGAREEIEARLRLYQERQPFRQTPAAHGP